MPIPQTTVLSSAKGFIESSRNFEIPEKYIFLFSDPLKISHPIKNNTIPLTSTVPLSSTIPLTTSVTIPSGVAVPLASKATLTPGESHGRITYIDESHRRNTHSGEPLRRTLEPRSLSVGEK